MPLSNVGTLVSSLAQKLRNALTCGQVKAEVQPPIPFFLLPLWFSEAKLQCPRPSSPLPWGLPKSELPSSHPLLSRKQSPELFSLMSGSAA